MRNNHHLRIETEIFASGNTEPVHIKSTSNTKVLFFEGFNLQVTYSSRLSFQTLYSYTNANDETKIFKDN